MNNRYEIEKNCFSFKIDGAEQDLKAAHTKTVTDGSTVTDIYEFGNIRVTNVKKYYDGFDSVEWVNYFENTGDTASPIISDIFDADISLPLGDFEEIPRSRWSWSPKKENALAVYTPTGSSHGASDFECLTGKFLNAKMTNWLTGDGELFFESKTGRSSDTDTAPFFNLNNANADLGVVAAVGWSGCWKCSITRKGNTVSFKSGIREAKFRLLPNEKLRTSSVTFMFYKSDLSESVNKWRRFVKAVYSPTAITANSALLPFCAGIWGGMSTKSCLERLDLINRNGLPFNYIWMDAGWFGDSTTESPNEYEGDWYSTTGDWSVNSYRHPDGLKEVSAAVKASGRKFLLWFEPERAVCTSKTAKEHPEYFLDPNDGSNCLLLNLGDEKAWNYCFDTISEYIEKLDLSVLRIDFNINPAPAWKGADSAERTGITEIKYINGLYRLWDGFLSKFPNLLIDNCASGGRRIDIETMRRSVALWRNDALCPADPNTDILQQDGMNFPVWLPYSGTGCGRIKYDTYRFRSAFAPMLTTNYFYSEADIADESPEFIGWLKARCSEYLKAQKYLDKDYYPLTDITCDGGNWSAVEFYDPDSNSGIIQIFRRENSPYSNAVFELKGLKPECIYTLCDADSGIETRLTGKELMGGFKAELPDRRSSRLIFFNGE